MSVFVCHKCGDEFEDLGSAHAHSHRHFSVLENLWMLVNPFVNLPDRLDENITELKEVN